MVQQLPARLDGLIDVAVQLLTFFERILIQSTPQLLLHVLEDVDHKCLKCEQHGTIKFGKQDHG